MKKLVLVLVGIGMFCTNVVSPGSSPFQHAKLVILFESTDTTIDDDPK